MPITESQETFINRFADEILRNNAAVFAGAGLSMAAGFADWKGLMSTIATALKVNVDRFSDLSSLAQYSVNGKGGLRSEINQKIIEKLSDAEKPTINHTILASLPIKTYWTTNYDTLLEDALKAADKIIDVKHETNQLSVSKPGRDAVVYKMHGDVNHPADAVIIKDDYESYNEKRQLFTTLLINDLLTKTFLFMGFGFEDPNLAYILSRMRILMAPMPARTIVL